MNIDKNRTQTIAAPLDVLRSVFGYPAFRHNQEAIIHQLLQGQDAVVLMPTGGGKSLCYQIPALCLPGVTIVVSPLIALMKDQVDALLVSGVKAAFLNSSQTGDEQSQILRQLRQNELKLLYVAPERLVRGEFNLLHFLQDYPVSLFAIDEAHCISQWGHDFRTEYRVLNQLKQRFPQVPLIALTATADAITRDDIIQQLALQQYQVFENSFNRPNISYQVYPKKGYYDTLVSYLETHKEDSGIIYCLSRNATEKLAEDLQAEGFSANAYHAGLDKATRDARQDLFLKDDIRIMVATIAFGMGINKSNVRFVIHADLPKNIEGYYQETGRAGRDGLPSEALLFYGAGDVIKLKGFAQVENNPEQTELLLKKLDQMVQFCETRHCRRKFLLGYFGEKAPDYCGNCDTCLSQPDLKDNTIVAQKLLSAVYRIQQSYGLGYIIDVLRGSQSEKIRENHRSLSVYGIGKDMSKDEWFHYGKELIEYGYLQKSETAFPVVSLTEKSKEVLFQKARVFLASPVQLNLRKEPVIYQQHDYEQPLFESLKRLRNQIAHEENVPAYLILSDSSLLDLATYLPLSQAALPQISGFGAFKIQKYGPPFLELIQAYCREMGLDTRIALKKAVRNKTVKQPKERASDTKRISKDMYRSGKTIDEIAEERQLSATTIESHLAFYITNGELSIDELVAYDKQKLIQSMITRYGSLSLKQLKDHLPASVSYGEIRMVVADTLRDHG